MSDAAVNVSHAAESERREVVTTKATALRDAPRGNAVRQLAAGTVLRITGDRDHGFVPVALPGQHQRGWVDRNDVAPRPDTLPDGGATGSGSGVPTGDVGARLVAAARRAIGMPFQLARHGPDTFDCSGLVCWVVQQVTGQTISPDSHAQFNLGTLVGRDQVRAGDLLFYDTQNGAEVRQGNTASHVGIYAGPGEMVNALNENTGVVVSDPFSAYFAPRFLGARRIV